jgi:alkanesulfonate monooxygenase SsuD/methylene tetrahydromethanopterin reductase-like flavin-dependent oxidoreductase (luciferase family)
VSVPVLANGRELKVGVFLPVDRRWSELRDMAVASEELGFDSLWLQDHLIFRRPTGASGAEECWTLLSALAASTRRVELGTLVICMPFRNPALLAKMADALDEVSDGRLILGVGAGWHEPEFDAFGYPFDHRVGRFEEAFTILTTLLREGRIDFAGTYYQARDCELLPRGPRPHGPPTLVGTSGERMLRLTARHADFWNGVWYGAPSDVAPRRDAVDAACRDVGRDPATLGRTAGLHVNLPGSSRKSGAAVGGPAELAELLRGFAAEGISHVQIHPDPWSLDSIRALAPALTMV